MSLVSDALRRARRETARLNAQRHGSYSLPGGSPQPRARMLTGVVVGVVLGLAAVVVVALALRWPPGRSRAGTPPGQTGPADRASLATAVPTAPQPPERTTSTALPPTAPGGSAELGSRPAAAGAEQTILSDALPPATVPAPLATDRPAPNQPPGEPNAPQSSDDNASLQSRPGQERVYVLHADLGYAKLQLDFIVYKPSAPFGRVNGQDIVPGSIVDGFLVEEIGRDFVRLRDPRGPVVLRVR